jgi:potassium-transporting ATPase KdpC subunit
VAALIRPALVTFALLALLTGVVYPALVTAAAQAAFPEQAAGSLIVENGRVRGSSLIGQYVESPEYFWGRPSSTSPAYNAAASTGSNLGPSNTALADAVEKRVTAQRALDPSSAAGAVPVDLVTASGSGLDPHLSPAAALYQVPRVAARRGLSEAALRELVERHTAGRALGFLGEPVVNVLELNQALDSLN